MAPTIFAPTIVPTAFDLTALFLASFDDKKLVSSTFVPATSVLGAFDPAGFVLVTFIHLQHLL